MMLKECSKAIMLFEVRGEPDRYGKVSFTVTWWDQNFHTGPKWRGQVFYADLKEQVRRSKAHGWKCRVVKERTL